MAVKPIIASPRGEWDARTLVLADLAEVTTWSDTSPLGTNHLTDGGGFSTYQEAGGAGTPWSATLPAVRMDVVGGPATDVFNLTSTFGGSGTAITIFVVAEVTDITGGMSFFGTADGINPPVGLYLFVNPDGSVWFSLGRDGGSTGSNTRSVPGVVEAGDRVLITARRLDTPQMVGVSSGPTIIRLNGEEIASDGSSGWLDFWFSAKVHRANLPATGIYPGAVDGDDGLLAHMLAYQSAASDSEILLMEAWLAQEWDLSFEPVTIWEPAGTQLPINTTWLP